MVSSANLRRGSRTCCTTESWIPAPGSAGPHWAYSPLRAVPIMTRGVLESWPSWQAFVATGPSLIIIADPNCKTRSSYGMMSYPNGGGEDRTLHHPDVHLLSVGGECGCRSRLLVLQRDASSILTSTVIHRQFDASAFHESLILSDAAFALQGQLSMLDREFYRCSLYGGEEMVFDTWSNRALARFVHPAFVIKGFAASPTFF